MHSSKQAAMAEICMQIAMKRNAERQHHLNRVDMKQHVLQLWQTETANTMSCATAVNASTSLFFSSIQAHHTMATSNAVSFLLLRHEGSIWDHTSSIYVTK